MPSRIDSKLSRNLYPTSKPLFSPCSYSHYPRNFWHYIFSNYEWFEFTRNITNKI